MADKTVTPPDEIITQFKRQIRQQEVIARLLNDKSVITRRCTHGRTEKQKCKACREFNERERRKMEALNAEN